MIRADYNVSTRLRISGKYAGQNTSILLRPYRGLASITDSWPRFRSHYDSIQFSFVRQYRVGVQLGFNYTIGIRNTGNMLSPPHFTHLPDGTLQFASNQDQLDELISNVGLRRNVLKGYGVWQLPTLHGTVRTVAALANGWQLSGTFTAGNGPTYDATYSYNSGGSNVNLTGSPSYAARIKVIGNPGSGCSGIITTNSTRPHSPVQRTTASATSRARVCCTAGSTIL